MSNTLAYYANVKAYFKHPISIMQYNCMKLTIGTFVSLEIVILSDLCRIILCQNRTEPQNRTCKQALNYDPKVFIASGACARSCNEWADPPVVSTGSRMGPAAARPISRPFRRTGTGARTRTGARWPTRFGRSVSSSSRFEPSPGKGRNGVVNVALAP
jgi:hypothetical protein